MTKKGPAPKNNNNKQKQKKPSQQALKVVKQVVPKGTAAAVGTVLGSLLGPKGAMLGGMAGRAFASITGVGDYTVSNNTIHTMGGSTLSGEVPTFGRQNDSTRVRHREFVADVVVPSTPLDFHNTEYVINPSNSTLFPWLANFAENYQQYELRGMVFVFKTTTSDYAASGSLGKIALSTNYNVRDTKFRNMQEVENSQFAVSGKPSLSHIHPIECAPNNGVPLRKWVRDVEYDASGGDDRLYDVGRFQIATSGLPMTAGTVIGELWVSYDFEFFKPVVARSSAEAQYEPVSVPVFNTVTGGGDRLIMSETSYLEVDTSSRANFDIGMRAPGRYIRYLNSQYNDTAKLARSVWRTSDPDPSSDPDGLFPAYWSNSTELILQRQGVYTISLKTERDPKPAQARGTVDAASANFANSSSAPNNMPDFSLHHISVQSVDASVDGKFAVFTYGAHGSYVPGTKLSSSTGVPLSGVNRYYAHQISGHNLVIHVYEDAGSGVLVKFNTDHHNSNQFLNWDGSNTFDLTNGWKNELNITYQHATYQTYYRPVVKGLNKDDKYNLNNFNKLYTALQPKLKELGLV